MTEEQTTTTTTEEAPLPCFVRHPDAGGQCWEPATTTAYGLDFCETHGGEVNLGALLDEQNELDAFLAGFRDFPSPVARAFARLDATERVSDSDYWAALVRAYPDPPQDVRERVIEWEASEEPGYQGVVDSLLDTLATLFKLMRIAHEERETWLVELLERERERSASEAAVALERADNRESVRAE